MTLEEFAYRTKEHPISIHINPMGFFRTARSNELRFERFDEFIQKAVNLGANISIPTYSYSFTKNDVYDRKKSPSALDGISAYLSEKYCEKRTYDANFSYILFGDIFLKKFLDIDNYKKYETFSEGGFIDSIYLQDGYLASIGGVLRHLTEIHYLEKRLDVPYRFDKSFEGLIEKEGNLYPSQCIYFCRRLELNNRPNFQPLMDDLQKDGLIELWNITEYQFKLEVVRFVPLYEYIKKRLADDPEYLLIDL